MIPPDSGSKALHRQNVRFEGSDTYLNSAIDMTTPATKIPTKVYPMLLIVSPTNIRSPDTDNAPKGPPLAIALPDPRNRPYKH